MKVETGKQFHLDSATGVHTKELSALIGTRRMNDEVFAQLVAEDVKNKVSDSQRDYLMLPQNRERWKRALLALAENLENQIDNINYDKQRDIQRYVELGDEGVNLLAEAVSAYDMRANKITRFKFHVNKRLDFVVSLGENESATSRVQMLESAIAAYLEERGEDIDDLDEALEVALKENKFVFDELESE
jgi:hypothetical protein